MPNRPDGDPGVYLGAERVLLAWIQTGLAMMGFGFVVARFPLFVRQFAAARRGEPLSFPGFSLWIGTALVILGVLVNVLAAAHHLRLLRPFESATVKERAYFSVGVAFALAAFGVSVVAYLLLVWPPS
jgi:putative membrane protein